jgi:chromatin segregation and condensation protein Rec8/ScpA/Scc1 (kleisin family)
VRLASIPPRSAVSTEEWCRVRPCDGSRATQFLALLELAREGVVLVHQEEYFAAIRIESIHEILGYLDIEAFLSEAAQAAAG